MLTIQVLAFISFASGLDSGMNDEVDLIDIRDIRTQYFLMIHPRKGEEHDQGRRAAAVEYQSDDASDFAG